MPIVRVFLFTYKRNSLLRRALKSLLDQSFKNWICELHNDCPEDLFPCELVNQINDSRVVYVKHEYNLGPTKSFNLAFSNVPEKYISLLEDDNWWEPDFLVEMVNLLECNPKLNIHWSDMNLWQELQDGSWKDIKKTINNFENQLIVTTDSFQMSQITGAIHSNGAMLFRSVNAEKYKIPDSTWFDFVESVRERCFDYPIALYNKPLANFALTINTSRTKDISKWNAWQVMLIGSYFSIANNNKEFIIRFWKQAKMEKKNLGHHYYLGLFFYPKLIRTFKYVPLSQFIFFLLYYLKHIPLLFKTIKNINNNRSLKDFIDNRTSILLTSFKNMSNK